MDRVEAVVVGGGVIGLAIARALALSGRETIVIEAEGAIGSITSARNSEVIHGGLYYPTASLKARLCVAGRHALYAFCDQHGVAYRRCGKLIVAASPAEAGEVEALHRQAHLNGVEDVRLITAAEVAALEPDLRSAGGLLSPSSGVLDSHGYMLALQGDLEAEGGAVALHAPLLSAGAAGRQIVLEVGGEAPLTLETEWLINAAGLGAWAVSDAIAGLDRAAVPARHLAKGNYYALAGRSPFRHLVYPVPEPGGLGVHLTLDLAGQARFGPDVEWIEVIDYTVDPRRADRFYAAIRRYWPGLPEGALVPAYAGIRPKITGPGAPAGDFVIQGPDVTGLPGYVALYGIESPGLTASLAIADDVVARLG